MPNDEVSITSESAGRDHQEILFKEGAWYPERVRPAEVQLDDERELERWNKGAAGRTSATPNEEDCRTPQGRHFVKKKGKPAGR